MRAHTFQQGECTPGLNTVEGNPYIILNLLLVLNPYSRNVFLVPIKYIYMRPNVDGSKHQENQVKVTDVKRCSFCTLQENIQIVADLFRAFKKQITIQAKLSCCYCSGSVLILLHSTTCKNGVTLQCISQKKLQHLLLYLLHGTQ